MTKKEIAIEKIKNAKNKKEAERIYRAISVKAYWKYIPIEEPPYKEYATIVGLAYEAYINWKTKEINNGK